MRRTVVCILAFGLSACAALGGGGPGDVPLSMVALRADPGTAPVSAAGALMEVRADYALVAAPADSAWFASVAEVTGLRLSGPAETGDLSLAFLGAEPLGDTAIDLTYDGGTITLQDALYDLGEEHYLDLMALQVDTSHALEPLVTSLLRYVATDVLPTAALVIAVAVPNAAVGDTLARLLGPANFSAFRCAGEDPPAAVASGILLFYGPERRIRCGDAEAARVAAGLRIHADLVAGWR